MENYKGLSEKSRMGIIIVAALIACFNLAAAWYETNKAMNSMALSDDEIKQIITVSNVAEHPYFKGNKQAIRVHAMDLTYVLKGIINKQMIIVVCLGAGFALLAIGFALFLIGADGAFKLKAQSAEHNLVLSSTAPGVLCFVLAAILIGIAATREVSIDPGDIKLNDLPTLKAPATKSQTTPDTKPVDKTKGNKLPPA